MTLPHAATLYGLADWLADRLGVEDAPLLRRDGPQGVDVLALALAPADLPGELEADALFLHRAFRLGGPGPDERWPGLGVLASHDPFDLQLTTGPNRALAAALGWTQLEPLGWKGRPLGLTATPPQRGWTALLDALDHEFGGHEAVQAPRIPVRPRLALMNALRPELLDLVHERGVNTCLTGQLRPGALGRARELDIGVVALGHRRTELWGLRQLGRELEAAFPGLVCRVYGQG